MNAIAPDAEWQAGVEDVHAQAAGAVEIAIVMQAELDDLLLDALAGGWQAQTLLRPVLQILGGIAEAPASKPMLCAVCPRPVRPDGRFNLAMAIPARDDASRALGLAICGRCATEPADVMAKAIDGFRRFWPDMRTVTVTHDTGGRA